MSVKKASQNGVRRLTASLEALASAVQHHHAALGIPEKVAMDFALRCDKLADHMDKQRTAGYYDPSQIGEEVPGPEMFDKNNPFMAGHFTQERFDALSGKQESGSLASNAEKHVADPKLAALLRKAADELEGKKSEEKPEEKKGEEKPEDDAKKAASYFRLFG